MLFYFISFVSSLYSNHFLFNLSFYPSCSSSQVLFTDYVRKLQFLEIFTDSIERTVGYIHYSQILYQDSRCSWIYIHSFYRQNNRKFSWIYSQIIQIRQQEQQLDISTDSKNMIEGYVGYIHKFYRQESSGSWIYSQILQIGQQVKQLDISIDSTDRTGVVGYIHRFYRQDSRCNSWIYSQILQIRQQVQQLDISIDYIDRTVGVVGYMWN